MPKGSGGKSRVPSAGKPKQSRATGKGSPGGTKTSALKNPKSKPSNR